MFSLAHLSDPHIGPIATPRLRELLNKRGLGLINWYRKRHRHHHADVLAAIVSDMQAQSPGPHRGDRRPGQHLARHGIRRRGALADERRARRST